MMKESRRHFAFILRLSRWDRTLHREFSVSSQGARIEWLQAIKLVNDISNRDVSLPEKAGTCERNRQHSRKITLDDFELIRTLGRGFFGKVLLARERTSDRPYAIKIISKESVATKARAEQTMAERRTLQKTSHPFLITLKYSFQTRDRLCFVMEYAPGGELLFHLVKERYFNEEKTRFYGAEILLALEYLHEQGIIYRDLKLENLLLDRDGHIKITDFGLCKEGMTYGRTTNTFCGTPDYLAPEVLDGDGYGRAVDWWGLGVVLYEMMSGRFPFECKNQKLLYDRILNNEVRIPHSLSRYAKSLLRGLLTKDPEIRLGGGKRDAKDIKEHAFFRTVPWEELLAKEIAPPFKPQVASGTDSRYFDPEFTEQSVCLTPICFSNSSRKATPFFREFSYCEDSE